MLDLLIAVVIDFIIGDPPTWPHPIRFMGNTIAFEDKLVRKVAKSDRGLVIGGFFIVIVNMLLAFGITYIILKLLKPYTYVYHIVNIYIIYTCIAARCLRDEAVNILKAFDKGIEEARYKLSFIVGRETKHLDEQEIVRATVETVAENTADGVIAPLFFAMIGGAPAATLYKMINTMDSMLGYMNEKYRHIGFFPAKTDDLFNFIPARLTGIFMNISGIFKYDVLSGFKVMIRDRKNHKSPNCAYPEGAVAGLLGVQLGGDNVYFGQIMKKPRIGDARRILSRDDIKRTVEVMFRTEVLFVVIYSVICLIISK
ncbi:cobalamin biosynthesis protein CobD [Fervidicella metallireducens AeB]|uniref:Cobalamin biosynthesis protein CobD n=1 Tax=Fervidicella metallireducens AeB TaxID=1403537 RepID=A0A017RZ56_9CLOT|nr:adenosylcobinamide-phosphate synthase CbiB [Fervidicella metallireducens]EYE89220.1 cobalamin biosynthesis protein CobD [Fervidicella metallireducens AeB]